ncbi:unnamed protein product [Sphagnum balticum]
MFYVLGESLGIPEISPEVSNPNQNAAAKVFLLDFFRLAVGADFLEKETSEWPVEPMPSLLILFVLKRTEGIIGRSQNFDVFQKQFHGCALGRVGRNA